MIKLETVMLKESVHLRGAYRDYFSKDHLWIESIKSYENGTEIELEDGRTINIPDHNVAGLVMEDNEQG